MKVSICIPTYNRVHLLLEALQSCLEQSVAPYEILIGDDSSNNETQQAIAQVKLQCSVPIRYFKNEPSLKQANNINMLFSSVAGDKVVLLHDDDLLLPQAIEKLSKCFLEYPEIKVVYGKQYIIDEAGQIGYAASENLNKAYYRTKKYEGQILMPLEAGFVQQFPNNGYMLDASGLQRVNYRTRNAAIGALGYGCEYDFGIQIGVHDFKMFFINEYLAKYRMSTTNSISSSSADDAALKSFMILRETIVPPSSRLLKANALKSKVALAIVQAVRSGRRKEALKLYFSKWHLQKILTLGGLKRFFFIVFP